MDLSLLPNLTRSKMVTVNFGSNTPKQNVKYFFNYDLEVKESKTVGIIFNTNGSHLIYKFDNVIGLTYADALNSCYINLVDKDNNTVCENLPLNALFRYLYAKGSFRETSMDNAFSIRKFNTEIDWAKSYVIFYDSPGTLSGAILPLTIYYKRKIK